jgi:hypothetical protein
MNMYLYKPSFKWQGGSFAEESRKINSFLKYFTELLSIGCALPHVISGTRTTDYEDHWQILEVEL